MSQYCKICFEKIRFSFLRNVIEKNIFICQECQDKININITSTIIDDVKIKCLSKYDGLLKQALITYKEGRDYELKDIFLYFFIPYIKLMYHNYIFIPIPSKKENILKRGFNHLTSMLSPYKLKIVEALENISTSQQKNLNASKRRENNSIILNNNVDTLRGKKLVLFDDVMTTGNTISSAIKEIKKISPKKIKGLILMQNTYKIS